MSKEKVYISGKATGIEKEAIGIFAEAEKELQKLNFETVNPMTLNHDHDLTWQSYMRKDIKELCDCDSIYMLNNWMDSKGAILEYQIAVGLGLDILFEENMLHPANIFRADYKYAERSHQYTTVESPLYNDWMYKEHQYTDAEYFHRLTSSRHMGYLIREFNTENVMNARFKLYKCEIEFVDTKNRIVIFKVSDMTSCNDNIINILNAQ